MMARPGSAIAFFEDQALNRRNGEKIDFDRAHGRAYFFSSVLHGTRLPPEPIERTPATNSIDKFAFKLFMISPSFFSFFVCRNATRPVSICRNPRLPLSLISRLAQGLGHFALSFCRLTTGPRRAFSKE